LYQVLHEGLLRLAPEGGSSHDGKADWPSHPCHELLPGFFIRRSRTEADNVLQGQGGVSRGCWFRGHPSYQFLPQSCASYSPNCRRKLTQKSGDRGANSGTNPSLSQRLVNIRSCSVQHIDLLICDLSHRCHSSVTFRVNRTARPTCIYRERTRWSFFSSFSTPLVAFS